VTTGLAVRRARVVVPHGDEPIRSARAIPADEIVALRALLAS
jgi:hypothetical protein